jgi:hypothetical protein
MMAAGVAGGRAERAMSVTMRPVEGSQASRYVREIEAEVCADRWWR